MRRNGTLPEFTEYQPYHEGDDPRRRDWKLFARTDCANRHTGNGKAASATVLIVDSSSSMAFPAATHAKWKRACELAVGLTAVAHAAGDPVGVVVPVTSGGTRFLAPRILNTVVADVARSLEGIMLVGETPLTPLLSLLPPTTRVAIISDFLGDVDELLKVARKRLEVGSEIYAIHVVAREEVALTKANGLGRAKNSEHPERVFSLEAATREGYARVFAAWRAEVAKAWRGAGADYTEVLTDEQAAQAVRRVVCGGIIPISRGHDV